MARRGGFPGGGGFPGMGGGNMQQMLAQAQKMQQNMEKAMAELEEKEFSFSAGGGAVSATVSGARVLKTLSIKPEVIDPEDADMLCDLLIAAVNGALGQVDEATSAITQGVRIPGM